MNLDAQDAEDAAFYAQLTRQILLLMDEDDQTHTTTTTKGAPGFGRRPESGNYFGWSEGGKSLGLEVPGWMESLWANNGLAGTGVFIPRAAAATAKPRRRRRSHKSRKKNDGGRIIHSSPEQKIHG